jgi:hypothetical protein
MVENFFQFFFITFYFILEGFHQTKSSPDHLYMYGSSLADDAHIAYEYGLTSTPISNDFSFADQRNSPIQYFPPPNRSYSMPQQQVFPIQPFEQVKDVIINIKFLSSFAGCFSIFINAFCTTTK